MIGAGGGVLTIRIRQVVSLITLRRSRNGSSERSVGESSNPRPSVLGVQCLITAP